MTDQANNQVNYTYDYANQLRSVVEVNHPDASHNTTTYAYDANGNLNTQTDKNTHATQNGFDVLNQLNKETMPVGQTQTRTYDAAGNLKTLTDYNGKTTTYTYDTLNRLTGKTPDPSLTDTPVSFTYTATGKRATMVDASGTTQYTYDSQDRLITKATPQGTLSYTYDAAGNVASMASSNVNGILVNYTYDELNRLTKVVDGRLTAGQNTTTYSYDPASNLATVTYPNGLQSTFTYDDLNRLKALNTYQYTLGPTGNRTGATESGGRTLNWTYDGIYRLTSESITGGSVSGAVTYGLDPVGNRLSQNSTLSPIASIPSLSYDANDRLSTETYDNNGNTVVSGARTFTYDFENRLKTMTMNGATVSIVYDGDGNRVAKTANGITTQYLVDNRNPTGYAQVIEELVNGSVQRRYTYGKQRINQNQIINGTRTTSFYGYDGFGSVRQLTDTSGTVTDSYDFDAWGNAVNTTGSTPNVYLYRGEQYDSDLRLYYLRARHFNPLAGRFLTSDSEMGVLRKPTTLHKYVYAYADPTNIMDPSGHGFYERAQFLVLMVLASPVIQQVGEEARGWLSLGLNSFLRASYYYDFFFEGATEWWRVVRGLKNVVASGQFLTETGEVVNATAVSGNRWIPELEAAAKGAGDIIVDFEPEAAAGLENAHHAEVILVEWAKQMGYKILSIGVAGGPGEVCPWCSDFLRGVSDAQRAACGYGFPFIP